MNKILIIQTAFIGDVILATPLIEALHHQFPNAKIDFLLRKGNEGLLEKHPFLNQVLIWNKKQDKIKNMFRLLSQIKTEKYDEIINVQRFLSSGILTAFSKAKHTTGFSKNPLSFWFSQKINHLIGNNTHEVQRNLSLIEHLCGKQTFKPKLYPTLADFEKTQPYKTNNYICIAPTSVWFTKQLPANKWLELIFQIPEHIQIYLLGSSSDFESCEAIRMQSKNKKIENLSGKLSFLESAALMRDADMNYVNDSAPMHLASSMNAKTTAIFCSTIPEFGFGPLSEESIILQVSEKLPCRPCGLHGFKVCPKQHFLCAEKIKFTIN